MKDISHYKKILEEDRDKLTIELNGLGVTDPSTPGDWDVKVPSLDVSNADENEFADRAEEQHIDSIVLDELEIRYRNVCHALKKIDAGTYGICEVSGQPIEEDRLEANPAARTCKAHMGEEGTLEAL
jgi:RNA polymerase-binding transcription factor DksA